MSEEIYSYGMKSEGFEVNQLEERTYESSNLFKTVTPLQADMRTLE